MEAASTLAPAAMPQHMQALAHANRVRLARASLKRDDRDGAVDAAEIVRQCPWEVESMPVGELLRSQRRWGRTRARKFLFSIALNENRELGRLTSRQRELLAVELEARRPNPVDHLRPVLGAGSQRSHPHRGGRPAPAPAPCPRAHQRSLTRRPERARNARASP